MSSELLLQHDQRIADLELQNRDLRQIATDQNARLDALTGRVEALEATYNDAYRVMHSQAARISVLERLQQPTIAETVERVTGASAAAQTPANAVSRRG